MINQPFAIGDILFIEPICRAIMEKTGSKPTLPVMDHLMWMGEYIESANLIPRSKNDYDYDMEDHNNKDQLLHLRFANQIIRNLAKYDHGDFENVMLDKYELAWGFSFIDHKIKWQDLKINLNGPRSIALFDELVGPDLDYVLVNEHCQAGDVKIMPNTEMPIIRMHERSGYTLLDWALVMLYAKENHHVSTSTFYIFQALDNLFPHEMKSRIFIYPRPNADGLRGISKLEPTFLWTAGK